MRAYPSSFRAILDLVVANGLEGEALKEGQTVQWPEWHESRQQQQSEEQTASSSSSSGDLRNQPHDTGASAANISSKSQPEDTVVSSSTSGGEASDLPAGSPASAGDGSQPGLDSSKVQVVLVGATVTEAEVEEAVARHWVTEPVVVRVGAPGRVPKGLRHRALVVADNGRRLAALVAMLRRDLAQAGQDEEPARVSLISKLNRDCQLCILCLQAQLGSPCGTLFDLNTMS